jgi:hypothetical protein
VPVRRDGVEDHGQLAHGGGERKLLGFSRPDHALVEGSSSSQARCSSCERRSSVSSQRRLPDRLADPARPAPVVRFVESIDAQTTPLR